MLKALGMNYDFCNFQMDEKKNVHVYACVERWSRHGRLLTNVESGGKAMFMIIVVPPSTFLLEKSGMKTAFLKRWMWKRISIIQVVITWQLIPRRDEAALNWERIVNEELTKHEADLSAVIYGVYVSF